MPDNSLAPPNMPWLWQPNSPVGQPNGLGPPMLNYAAPPPDTSQGAGVAAAGQQAWQWLQDQRAESVRQGLLDPDTGLPTQKGVVEGARATAEGVMLGTTAPGDVPPPGIVAYHGSPHSFDQFDTSKIGTGEGAQAYGHGLYFAEGEGVARSYRDALTPTDHGFIAMDSVLGRFAGWSPAEADVREALTGHDVLTPLADNPAVVNAVRRLAPDYNPSGAVTGEALRHYRTINDAIEAAAPKGHMYEVNIGADPEHFLDWDKPLSEQSQHVQDAVKHSPILADAVKYGDKPENPTGRQIHQAAVSIQTRRNDFDASQAAVAQALQDAGIPGISYLDAGSRGAGTGTKNHVVFDANTIDILRKYGLAGLIAGGGAAAAATQQQQPSQ